MEERRLRIVVDDREQRSGLPAALAARWRGVEVGRLALGDVQVGPRVLVERKTVADFVASLVDGRLYRQASALNRTCSRPLLIVEGEDAVDAVGLSPDSFRGTLLTLAVAFRIPMLRTGSTDETAEFIAHLAWQEERRLARREDGRPAPPPARVAAEMLGVIPGVGDMRARRLIDRFGDVPSVLGADAAELTDVPGIGKETARAIRHVGGRGDDRAPDRGRVSDCVAGGLAWRAATQSHCGAATMD